MYAKETGGPGGSVMLKLVRRRTRRQCASRHADVAMRSRAPRALR